VRRKALRLLEAELEVEASAITNYFVDKVRSSLQDFGVSKQISFKGPPDMIQRLPNVNSVTMSLEMNPKQAGVAVRGHYAHGSKDIGIEAQVSPSFSSRDLRELSMEFGEKIRHELEHTVQSKAILRKTPPSPNPGKIKTVSRYYADEGEVSAHVAGLWKHAKDRNLDFKDLVKSRLEKLRFFMLKAGTNSKASAKLIKKIEAAWVAHAQRRYG
jgi:hypothetical protein